LKVILSSELPRSPIAFAVVGFVVGLLFVGELATSGFLERDGDRAGFAFVAEVTERGSVLGDPDLERGKDLQMFAQRGRVVLAARTDLGCPQRPAVRGGDDLDVPAVVGGSARLSVAQRGSAPNMGFVGGAVDQPQGPDSVRDSGNEQINRVVARAAPVPATGGCQA
jgi:hypothetical protein